MQSSYHFAKQFYISDDLTICTYEIYTVFHTYLALTENRYSITTGKDAWPKPPASIHPANLRNAALKDHSLGKPKMPRHLTHDYLNVSRYL